MKKPDSNLQILKQNAWLFTMALILFCTCNREQRTADWISRGISADTVNTWTCYRKQFSLKKQPVEAITKIATDSKYWLYVNDSLVVREGGLKRGPSPGMGYYDVIDLSTHLKEGLNTIAILNWFFGKDGYSHVNSGKSKLYFDMETDETAIISDSTWKVHVHPGFYTPGGKKPNFRLPESSVGFDARKNLKGWYKSGYNDKEWSQAISLEETALFSRNNKVMRPIPLWKDFGIKPYKNTEQRKDTLVGHLPYNAQVTPILKINAPAGERIRIFTDHFMVSGDIPTVCAEYITIDGTQEFEVFNWMNGHKVYYTIPQGVKVLGSGYRETGYNTEFKGKFESSDAFLNQLWIKSRRSLYVNMRDNFMDCPDRERAQWWGDVTTELEMAFYSLDSVAPLLGKKAILELARWQKNDSTLYAPVPSGNFNKELPGQMLVAIGFGVMNYYLYTGDTSLVKQVYPNLKGYINKWNTDTSNLLVYRKGDWDWCDWGDNIDKQLLQTGLYAKALESMIRLATISKNIEDTLYFSYKLNSLSRAVNETYWRGTHYASPGHQGTADDRGNALMVLAGIARNDHYPALTKLLRNTFHASPYMEKYVLQALCEMGQVSAATRRIKTRYKEMNQSPYSTLWEKWEFEPGIKNGGTNNHGWAGGPLVIMSRYLAGISPLEPGYAKYQIYPDPGHIHDLKGVVATPKGTIKYSSKKTGQILQIQVQSPGATNAVIRFPKEFGEIYDFKMNNEILRVDKQYTNSNDNKAIFIEENDEYVFYKLAPGTWQIKVEYINL